VASNEAARWYGPSAPASGHEVLASADPPRRFLSPHQAAVLDAAIHRLVAGPEDDPLALGYPPARRAPGVTYLDRLLPCVAGLRDRYTDGVAMLDRQAGGDFTAVPRLCQDLILSQGQVAPFARLLFDHIVEAMYAAPESADPLG
jgi:hypothetical protein